MAQGARERAMTHAHIDEKLRDAREATRAALAFYVSELKAAEKAKVGPTGQRQHYLVELTQAKSAQRVLWFES